jgi:hypothetical protein
MESSTEFESDYFISLSSKKDLDRFSRNHNVDFINYLNEPVSFDPEKCLIGLAHLSFQLEEFEIPPNIATPVKPSLEASPLFGTTANDNLIAIWTNTPTTFTVKNQGRNVKELFTKLSEGLKLAKAPVDIYLTMGQEKSIRVKLIFTDTTGRDLLIQRELADILGFQKVTFGNGEHIAENEMNNVRFLEYPKENFFIFEISNWKVTRLPMDEPVTRDLDDVAFSVTMAIRSIGRLRDVGIASEDGTFVLTFHKPNIKLSLPAAMNRYLNLSEEYVFTDVVTEVRMTTVHEDPIEEPTQEVTISSSKLIYVLCDAIQSHRVGNSFEPIIRTILKPSNKDWSLDFNPVFYTKPTTEEIRHIRFRLVDTNFQPLKQSDTETVAILHVKTRQQ